jgi:hypothetical protein
MDNIIHKLLVYEPIRIFDEFSHWIVVGWMILHTLSWAIVEGCRLYWSTKIKIRRIFIQDVAEE